ncbi:hypothetical protein [Streptomyces scopuliridis]|uniref:hypothetical protein n=1 Tax=Streptomyces scopuliridis TaxID=452529 RepID=UPI0036981CF5
MMHNEDGHESDALCRQHVGDGGVLRTASTGIRVLLKTLAPTGKGRKRWTMSWEAPLIAFQLAFGAGSPLASD